MSVLMHNDEMIAGLVPKREWKLAGSTTGSTALSFPTTANELLVLVRPNNAGSWFSINIPTIALTDANRSFTSGYNVVGSSEKKYVRQVTVSANNTGYVALSEARYSQGVAITTLDAAVTETTPIEVYYR